MAYATQSELEDAAGGAARFLELTDWDNNGVSDAVVVGRAQASAEEWIDETLKSRYAVPLTTPTAEIREIAAAETIYRLKLKRGMIGAGDPDVDAHKERVRILDEYRSGLRRPGAPESVRSTQGRSAIITSEDSGATVSRRTLKGLW